MASIVYTLISVMKALDKLEATGGKMTMVGAALLLVAGGMVLMGIAVSKLAKIDTVQLIQAGVALSYLSKMMTTTLTSMDKINLTGFKSTAVIGIAAGLWLAASAVAKLGSIDIPTPW